MSKLLDEVTYIVRQLEILLFGDYRKRLPVRIMTDSEPTLESIASTKQIERKGLQMTVQEMNEKLMEGEIKSNFEEISLCCHCDNKVKTNNELAVHNIMKH